MASQGNAPSTRAESDKKWQKRRDCNGAENKSCPHQWRSRRQKPSHNQCKKCGGSGQSSAKVVDNLPAADDWDSDGLLFLPPRLAPSKKPGQQLPVTASPTILARHNRFITRRKFLKQLNIRGQGYPGEDAFKEIMA